MSLSTFRLLSLSLVVLVISNTSAFSVRRTTTLRDAKDLYADESRVSESSLTASNVKSTLQDALITSTTNAENQTEIFSQIPEVSTDVSKPLLKVGSDAVDKSTTLETKEFGNKEIGTEPSTLDRTYAKPKKKSTYITTPAKKPSVRNSVRNENYRTRDKLVNLKADIDTTTIKNIKRVFIISEQQLRETTINDVKDFVGSFPPWKKYTIIRRNKVQDVAQNKKDVTSKPKDVTQEATSLRDTITSDIPSLEKLKNDLLSAPTKIKHSEEFELNTNSDDLRQETDITASDSQSYSPINSISAAILNQPLKSGTVESKRAGYLDYTDKNREQAGTDTANTEESVQNDRHDDKKESQIQLIKDLIRENMQEEVQERNDYTSKGYEEGTENHFTQTPVDVPYSPSSNADMQDAEIILNTSTEDKLQMKLVNGEKSKNVSLYTVSPNYKPLKKLEVQQPKPFVRDPDDNSWRNESISSLGIVFKPKNSSKPFTQVLRNKTETEWNNLSEKDRKNDLPDLRERLEQMAKVRKTKRKKIDSLGNVVYVDYEDGSSSYENISPSQDLINIPAINLDTEFLLHTIKTPSTLLTDDPKVTITYTTTQKVINKDIRKDSFRKPKKFNIPDYYESMDEDELDYLNLAKIDIKKFTSTQKTTVTSVTQSPWPVRKSTSTAFPERKGTIQYFPPLSVKKQHFDKHDNLFKMKVTPFTTIRPSTNVMSTSYPDTTRHIDNKVLDYPTSVKEEYVTSTSKPTTIDDDFYFSQPPRMEDHNRYTVNGDDGNKHRGPEVIKNYGGFVNEAAKDDDFERHGDYVPYTQAPVPSVTINEVSRDDRVKDKVSFNEDYDEHFRKDVLNRFVENFNINSDRMKPEFPVIFNSSIIHSHGGRQVASSRAFLRGLYEVAATPNTHHRHKPQFYDPNCENATVELSPAYELHYFVPEQEEKEVAHPHRVTPPYRYKL